MKHIKALFPTSVIMILIIFFGTVYGSSLTIQREGVLQKGQESVGLKTDLSMDSNQLMFTPKGLRDKNDSAVESQTGSQSVRTERYKPYKEGEGERKIK